MSVNQHRGITESRTQTKKLCYLQHNCLHFCICMHEHTCCVILDKLFNPHAAPLLLHDMCRTSPLRFRPFCCMVKQAKLFCYSGRCDGCTFVCGQSTFYVNTAAIMSILTYNCISVALNIVVYPRLTNEHQSPYRQGLRTQLCDPSCSDSCKP